MELIRGDETPEQIVTLAFGLEKGLQTFYRTQEAKTGDSELSALFSKLAGIEESHKRRLFEFSEKMHPTGKDIDAFEAGIAPAIMEGGFNIEFFTQQNKRYLATVQGVLTLAMMLETQGFDLYSRFADRSTDTDAKEIFFQVAEEEKAHIAALGRLLEDKI